MNERVVVHNNSGNVGCGCLPLLVTIFVLWALWSSLPTPWGKLELDLFPPAIRLDGK